MLQDILLHCQCLKAPHRVCGCFQLNQMLWHVVCRIHCCWEIFKPASAGMQLTHHKAHSRVQSSKVDSETEGVSWCCSSNDKDIIRSSQRCRENVQRCWTKTDGVSGCCRANSSNDKGAKRQKGTQITVLIPALCMCLPISITVTLQLLAQALHQPKVSDHRGGTSPDLLIRLLSPTAGPASTSAAAA